MMIHEVTAKVGKHKKRKRVGRGIGSGHGKTCGRGHKGAGSRAGATGSIRASREGGQMPWFRRVPKRGFGNSLFRRDYKTVNIGAIDARFESGAEVNPEALVRVGLVHDLATPVKILGEGELTKKLSVTAAAFSKAARQKIEDAGGAVKIEGGYKARPPRRKSGKAAAAKPAKSAKPAEAQAAQADDKPADE